MRIRLACRVLVLLGSIGVSQPVFAAPITTWYEVAITTHHDLYTNVDTTVDMTFLMSLTFDDQVTGADAATSLGVTYRVVYFGTPSFTGVPGALTAGAGPVSGTTDAEASESRLSSFGGDGPLGDGILSLARLETSTFSGSSGVQLDAELFPLPLGSVDINGATALTMLANLDAPTARFLSWSYDHDGTGYLPNSFFYEGTATQVDISSVPEPGTMTLVGIGLAGSALRARRRRSQV